MVLKKYIDEDIILVVTAGYFFSQEIFLIFNSLSANAITWTNTLKEFFGCCGRIV